MFLKKKKELAEETFHGLSFLRKEGLTQEEQSQLAEYLRKPEAEILVAAIRADVLSHSEITLSNGEPSPAKALAKVTGDNAVLRIVHFIRNYPKMFMTEQLEKNVSPVEMEFPSSVEDEKL